MVQNVPQLTTLGSSRQTLMTGKYFFCWGYSRTVATINGCGSLALACPTLRARFPPLVCYRFSAVTPIVSLFTRTTLTPSLTGMISTRSPFASVASIAFISFSDSLTEFFILYFTTMYRIVKGYAFSRLSFTRFLYSSVCSVAARFKKCIGLIPLLVPNS